MRYFPHTEKDIRAMLAEVGLRSTQELFSMVPEACRREAPMQLPEPLTEWELLDRLLSLSSRMATRPEWQCYLGAGSYDHYIPASATYLLGRSEFVTSYTPYQPEMSQGTLQAIYEYQSLTTRLLGLEVANASLYDGAAALAEALFMAIRITRRKRVIVSSLIHPHYRQVVDTYFRPTGYGVERLPFLPDGRTDTGGLDITADVAAVALQSPNFFGSLEDIEPLARLCRERGALLVIAFTEPLAYGLYRSPGSLGADIACGEGQSLGIPQSFGGPGLGMFATRNQYVRSMPGRLVGKTRDREGRRGFVLTLATREQHIRREKATSNICTNNSLCAVAASMYLASLGGQGFRELARLNYDKTEHLKQALGEAGFRVPFQSPTFNEFVVACPAGWSERHQRLLAEGVLAGLPLAPFYPELKEHYLLCVTETKSKSDLEALVNRMRP